MRKLAMCGWLMAVGIIPSQLYAQQPTDTLKLNLQQSIELLVSQNPAVKAANEAYQQKEYELQAAHGLYLPQVGVSATFGITSKPVTLDLSPVGDALEGLYQLSAGQTQLIGALNPAITATPQYQQLLLGAQQGLAAVSNAEWEKVLLEDKLGKVSADLKWPIFTGGKIMAANKAAKASANEMSERARMVTNSEITTLVQRYYGLQLFMEVAKVRKTVLEGMHKHLENARKMEANGMISEAERLHAEVAYAQADKEYKKAVKDVELMQTALKSTLNITSPVLPTSSMSIVKTVMPLESYIEMARQNNPVFGQLEQKKLMANQAITKERSAYLPDIAVMGSYDIYRYNMSDLTPDWYVGVGLKMNIFDGLAKHNKIQAAKIQRKQVETAEEKIALDITTGITKVYQQMEQAVEQYQSGEVSLKFALEYLRIREKGFSEGFATSTDVVDANMNLSKVRVEQLKSVYEYNVALAALMELAGTSQQMGAE